MTDPTMQHAPDACAGCGRPLESSTPLAGLCPVCLLGRAIKTAKSWGEAGAPRWSPPRPGELAGVIPGVEARELIGRGGMGAVYRAVHTRLGRDVALKVLPVTPDEQPGLTERFEREAQTLARLSHPAVVQVYDAGVAGPWHYLTMELVRGGSLAALLRFGPLPPAAALAVGARVARALAVIHRAGVVHRDVKPSNILLREGWLARFIADRSADQQADDQQAEPGGVVLADFGIAKPNCPDLGETDITAMNHVLGTPHYLAPEQAVPGQEIDTRADQYALGVTLYHALTGRLPVGQADPPSRYADLTPAVDAVVMRCLAQDPEKRFDDADQLAEQLEALTPSGGARRGSRLPARSLVYAAAGLLVGVLVTAVAITIGKPADRPPEAAPALGQSDPAGAEPDRATPQTSSPEQENPSDLSADPPGPQTEPATEPADPPAPVDPVTLSNLRITRDGGRHLVRVDYAFNDVTEQTSLIQLVVEGADGRREVERLPAYHWQDRGTIRQRVMLMHITRWPVECYLERPIIGTLDGGVRLSNVLSVERHEAW